MSVLARLWALRRTRPGFVALSVALLAALFAWPAADWWLRGAGVAPGFDFWDFGAYAGAVNRWLAGEPLYQRTEAGGFHGTFLYPPIVVVLFRQFAVFSFERAAVVWEVLSVGLLWTGMQLVAGSLGLRLRWYERGALLWLLVGFQPLLLSVKMGQTAAFMAGLLALSFVALDRGERTDSRPWAAASGAATAVVGAVKPVYAPVGAHLLADRDRMAGALAAGAVLLAASVLIFGVGKHRTYVEVLRWGVERGSEARSPALWLAPYYRPLGWLAESTALRVVGSAVVAGAAVFADGVDREVFALGVAGFPLLAPLAYTYYLVALLPAAAILTASELRRDGHPAVPVAGLLLVHLHSYGLWLLVVRMSEAVPATTALRPAYFLLQPGLWGAALLFGLALARVLQAASVPDPDDAVGRLRERLAR
ncbi:MAG: glycosyltransferase family 87 protein [Halobacteriales archaeon]